VGREYPDQKYTQEVVTGTWMRIKPIDSLARWAIMVLDANDDIDTVSFLDSADTVWSYTRMIGEKRKS
jgi:hypothetical protein